MLMGVDGIVVCVFEFISFFAVDYVIKLIGHMGVMYVGLLGYAIRFTVYASITNPWTVLPVEMLQGHKTYVSPYSVYSEYRELSGGIGQKVATASKEIIFLRLFCFSSSS